MAYLDTHSDVESIDTGEDVYRAHVKPRLPSVSWPEYHRSIHIHETDQDGVVHFSNYLRIAEEAMFNAFRTFGHGFQNTGQSVAMLDAAATYLYPMKFGDRIAVVLTECAIRRAKFMLNFEFRRNCDVCARVRLMLVTIDIDGRNAIAIPNIIKGKLTELSRIFSVQPDCQHIA